MLKLNLNGSEDIRFFPLAEQTQVAMTSDWASPSFGGAFLPVARTVQKTGFSANWQVSHFARSFPQIGRLKSLSLLSESYHQSLEQLGEQTASPGNIRETAFGVSLLDTVDFYRQVERVVKYGILFLMTTFLTFFIFEVVLSVYVHMFQYILVGLALCLFYLLLLAFSELIGFTPAYIIASVAIISLITYYCSGFVLNKKYLAIVPFVLGVLYAYLYVLLQLEDFSLLFGSIGLFVILAVLMVVTRKIRWQSGSKK